MAKQVNQALPGTMEAVTGDIHDAHLTSEPTGGPLPVQPPGATFARRESGVDWRTVDPSAIQGEGIPVEELRFYREKIDELLRDGAGHYVLIIGRKIISFFPDLEAAARHAETSFRGEAVLIKKVVAIEPVHSTGGAVG